MWWYLFDVVCAAEEVRGGLGACACEYRVFSVVEGRLVWVGVLSACLEHAENGVAGKGWVCIREVDCVELLGWCEVGLANPRGDDSVWWDGAVLDSVVDDTLQDRSVS